LLTEDHPKEKTSSLSRIYLIERDSGSPGSRFEQWSQGWQVSLRCGMGYLTALYIRHLSIIVSGDKIECLEE